MPAEFGRKLDASWRVPSPARPREVARASLQHRLAFAVNQEIAGGTTALTDVAKATETNANLLRRKMRGQLPITIEDLMGLVLELGVQVLPETLDVDVFVPPELTK